MAKQQKRMRKANFSEKEVQMLLEEVSLEHAILFSSYSQTVTQKRKHEIWQKITEKVNSCGIAHRTTQECKDKWKGLKGAVLNRQRDQQKTGGGPPPSQVPFEDLILRIIGRDSNLISGIAVEDTDTFEETNIHDSVSQQSNPTLTPKDLGPTPDCSDWSNDSGTQQSRYTFPTLPDAPVVESSVNYGNDGVIIMDVDTATPARPFAGKGKKRKVKSQSVSGKPVFDVSGQEDLVDEWLRSEISKNKAIETHLALRNRKLELQIAVLESQSQS